MRNFTVLMIMFVLSALFATQAVAESLKDIRPDFLIGCVAGGNEEADCACMFDNWSKDIPSGQEKAASSAIMMFLGKPPQNNDQMMSAARLLQGMTGVLLKCATESLSALPTQQADREAANIEIGQEHITRASGKANYEAELLHIHSQDITSWSEPELETLFKSYCQLGSGGQRCDCEWPLLAASNYPSATVYLASRSEGDDVLQRIPREQFNSALTSLYKFNDQRAACDV